jgi:hypothetical protein
MWDEKVLNALWEENEIDTDMMITTYKNADHLARLNGTILPAHLVPGLPVVITKLGMYTYYGDEGEDMADKIQEVLDALVEKNPDATLYQAVQAGMTASAVSMRTRAMNCVQGKDLNVIKNCIGSLPDIG